MRIALIGYGKMGKAIESIALERGHEIFLKISSNNLDELNIENLRQCDVAIEFSNPQSVLGNIKLCLQAKVALVVGTTAWLSSLQEIKEEVVKNNLSFVWASNFSLGANLLFKLNSELSLMMNNFVNNHQYDVQIEEIHHKQKLDAPSGTAITLANDVLNNIDSKKVIESKGINEKSIIESQELENFSERIKVNSLREDDVPGTHIINYFSEEDSITIQHKAFNRKGFALGAVIAAEKICMIKGFYEFREILF